MEKGIYRGMYPAVVIQNDDPQNRRVKIWAPAVNMSIYEDWDKDETNRYFNSLTQLNKSGSEEPDIQRVLTKLKENLPWAEIQLPVVGPGTAGKVLSDKGITTNENAPFIEDKRNATASPESGLTQQNQPNTNNNCDNQQSPNIPSLPSIPQQSQPSSSGGSGGGGCVNNPFSKPELKPTTNSQPFDPKTLEPKTNNPSEPFTNTDNSNSNVVNAFEMSIHYNRNGTIRSFSKSDNIDVNINNRGEILITDKNSNQNRLLQLPVTNTTIIDQFFPSVKGSKPNTLQTVNTINKTTSEQILSKTETLTIQNIANGNATRTANNEPTPLNSDVVNTLQVINGESVITTEAVNAPFEMSIHYNRNGTIRTFSKSDNINVSTDRTGGVLITDKTTGNQLMTIPSSNKGTIINSLFPSTKGSKPSSLDTINDIGIITPSDINQFNINDYTIASNDQALKQFNNKSISSSGPQSKSAPKLAPSGNGGTGTSGGTGSALATNLLQLLTPPSPITSNGTDHQGDYNNLNDWSRRTDKDINLNIGGGYGNPDTKTRKTYLTTNVYEESSDAQPEVARQLAPRSTSMPNNGNDFKGIVTLPEPGAKVYVMFKNGNPMNPVIVGYMLNTEDASGIYDIPEEDSNQNIA